MTFEFDVNDIVQTRKPHPCGSDKWRIIRTGADIKIKCLKCSRIVMMDRVEFLKRIKKIFRETEKTGNE